MRFLLSGIDTLQKATLCDYQFPAFSHHIKDIHMIYSAKASLDSASGSVEPVTGNGELLQEPHARTHKP